MSNKYIGFQRISLLKVAGFLISINNNSIHIWKRENLQLLSRSDSRQVTHKNSQLLCHTTDSSWGTFNGGDGSLGCYQGWRHCSPLSGTALLSAPSHLQDRQKSFVNRKWSWSYKSMKPVEAGVLGSGRLQKKLKMSQCVKNWEAF